MLISRNNSNRKIIYIVCIVGIIGAFFAVWRSKHAPDVYSLDRVRLMYTDHRGSNDYWYSNHEIVYWDLDQNPPSLTLRNIITQKNDTLITLSKSMQYDRRAFLISPNRKYILSENSNDNYAVSVMNWKGMQEKIWRDIDKDSVGMFWALDSQSWVMVKPVPSSTSKTQQNRIEYDITAHYLNTKSVQKTRIYLEQKNQFSWTQIRSPHAFVLVQEVSLYNTRTGPIEVNVLTFEKQAPLLQKQQYLVPKNLNVLSIQVPPDGQSLLWVLSPNPLLLKESSFQQMTLWISSLSSNKIHFVTNVPDLVYDGSYDEWNISWLPDGRHISFTDKFSLYVLSVESLVNPPR